MTDWPRRTVEANGLSVSYLRSGEKSGKPALLLLHGYTDSGACWTALAQDLEGTFDIIMPDARGHGRTVGPIEDLRVDLQAEDAAAVLTALGIKQAYVFGHSMGAMTALALAANRPELVRAAVLEDPPLHASDPFVLPEAERLMLETDAQQTPLLQALTNDERAARCRADNPNWSETEIGPWAESKGEYDPGIVKHRVGIRAYRWSEAIKRTACRLLLLTADVERGGLVAPATAAEAARLCPRCEVAHVQGAGHCIHRDQYGEVLRLVLAFFGRVG